VGQIEYKTPPTEDWYDPYTYTPPANHCSSLEAVWGPGLDFVETECNTNFQGYVMESVYSNCLKWLYDRTDYWVSCTDFQGWTTSRDSHGVDYNMGTKEGYNPAGNGADVLWTVDSGPYHRLDYVDEIVVEMFRGTMTEGVIPWMNQAVAHGGVNIGINFDQFCPVEFHNWWATEGVGEPNNRCWWEHLGFMQMWNYFREQLGRPFDAMLFIAVQSIYPQGPLPDLDFYLDFMEKMYIINERQEIDLPVTFDFEI
jgi:hypothetical protein